MPRLTCPDLLLPAVLAATALAAQVPDDGRAPVPAKPCEHIPLEQCVPFVLYQSDGTVCIDVEISNPSPQGSGSSIEVYTSWDLDGDPTTVEHETTSHIGPGQTTERECHVLEIRVHEKNIAEGSVTKCKKPESTGSSG